MRENKNQILEALTAKHIEAINKAKLSNVEGGNNIGCIDVIIPKNG